MRFAILSVLLMLISHSDAASHGLSHGSLSRDATTTDMNLGQASYAAVVHQASPECWKTALKMFRNLQQDTQQNERSAAAATVSPSELSLDLCSAMTSEHQDLLALEVTRCHMKGRSIFHTSSKGCSISQENVSTACIQQLTDTAFTTFTQFKIYIYHICSRVTAEMVLQKQHDMAHTLTELASHVQHRQEGLQAYWEQVWEQGQVVDEERHVRHQTWLAEQDGVHEKQQSMMVGMMSLAQRMESGQGVMQQFWDNVWDRARLRQEEWERQSATWLEQQQALQQGQIQHLERFRDEMSTLQGHHASLVQQHSQEMQVLVDRHKLDLEQTQQRHDELEEQRQANWLKQQQTVQQDQQKGLERHRDELQAWQADQTFQIEQHAQQIRALTEQHYQELQQWQQQQALQAQKHEHELQVFANGIANSAKPLLAAEMFVKRLFSGLTWWTSLVYLMAMLNLVWLLTIPQRCRHVRCALFAVAIAEVLLEFLLHRYTCPTNTTENNTSWTWLLLQSVCSRFVQHREAAIGRLRQGTVLLECVLYLWGFLFSFFRQSTPHTSDSRLDIRIQEMEARHLELLQRLEQRSSLITELLLKPSDMLVQADATMIEKGIYHYSGSQCDSAVATQNSQERFQNRGPPPKVVSPKDQPSPHRGDNEASLLPLPLHLGGRQDRKVAYNYDDDDDDGEDQQRRVLCDANGRFTNDIVDGRLGSLDTSFASCHEHQHTNWRQKAIVPETPTTSPLPFALAGTSDETVRRRRPKRTQPAASSEDLEDSFSSCTPPPAKVARRAYDE